MARSILSLITEKRDGVELTTEEIQEFVDGVSGGFLPEYQIGAMLMAIYLRGMTDRETADLTLAMAQSGQILDLSAIHGFKVDKHSTGGVGDKVTPILGPLVASAGVSFPKLSGRGLGHTGGTLDKLEAIPGFRVDLTIEEFIHQVNTIGLAVTGQSAELVPADGILYAMRDATATVASIPLIASSVMSKKIAAGADGIVLDVKCGRGAFVQTQEEATALARVMVAIGRTAGKRTLAFVTAMEEPLGYAVGNALEITEVISVLKGESRQNNELYDVSLTLGAHILVMAGQAPAVDEARCDLAQRIASGAALEKLREMIAWQGGDARVVDDPGLLPQAGDLVSVPSPRSGFIRRIDARDIGNVAMALGAGRQTKGDPIDPAVGVVLEIQAGDSVEPGQSLAQIHTNHRIANAEAIARTLSAFEIEMEPFPTQPHVLEMVTDEDVAP